MSRMYKGRLLANQPTAKPRLQLVPLEPRRPSQWFSGWVVLCVAGLFLIAGSALWIWRLLKG